MLFMLFLFPYSFYNRRILREKLVEVIHGQKKPVRITADKRTGTVTFTNSQPASSEQYQAASIRYKELYTKIDSCLDIALIVKELQSLKLLVKGSSPDLYEDDEAPASRLGQGNPPDPHPEQHPAGSLFPSKHGTSSWQKSGNAQFVKRKKTVTTSNQPVVGNSGASSLHLLQRIEPPSQPPAFEYGIPTNMNRHLPLKQTLAPDFGDSRKLPRTTLLKLNVEKNLDIEPRGKHSAHN